MRIAIGKGMRQQDAYKLLAAFMILIMIIVPVAYVITSPRSDTTQVSQTPESQQEKYNPEFWVVNQPFYSISDALNMTPVGAESVSYADIESMTPQMVQWARQDLQIIGEVDSIYKSNTTKMYYANLREGKNSSFLLLSTMFPEKNDFIYIALPNAYPPILMRQEQGISGLYNIMGNPAILAPPQTAIDTLEIIYSQNRTNTSYDRYEGLLSKVPPAPFQTLSSNVSFAKLYYTGIRFDNGSYERTNIYLNVNSTTMKNLTQLKANSTQKGFAQYNISRSGNYTIVRIISSDLDKVWNEPFS